MTPRPPRAGAPPPAPLLPLRVRGLVYAPEGAGRPVLDGVTFELESSGMTALVGPSGSGKTTLLHILAGFDPRYTGSVTLGGIDLPDFGPDGWSDVRRHRLGYMFQSSGLLPDLSVEDNVSLRGILLREPVAGRRERARTLLASIGLEPLGRRRPADLSGGESARVALLRALYGEPELILADEPTASLDLDNARAVVDLLSGYVRSRGAHALVATHDERLLPAFDRILRLRDGRLEG